MRVLSIMNAKGGVGKTTTAIAMAQILADEYANRILVVDADAQGNATSTLMRAYDHDQDYSGTYEMLLMGGIAADHISSTKYNGVDLVAASDDLHYTSFESAEAMRVSMSEFLEQVATYDTYDFVIIDCPPSFSAACIAALCCSDDVIIPMRIDYYSDQAMHFVAEQIDSVSEYNPDITDPLVLFTMYHNSPVCNQGIEMIRRHLPAYAKIMQTKIRRTDKCDEATFYRQSIRDYSRYSAAGRDYKAMVDEYIETLRRCM